MDTITLPQDLQAPAVATSIRDRATETSRGLGAELLANRTLSQMFTAFHKKTRASWDFTHGTITRPTRQLTPSTVRQFVRIAADPATQQVIAQTEYRAEIDDAMTTLTVRDEFGVVYHRPIRNGLARTLRVEGLAQTTPITAGRFLVRIVCD